MRLTHRFRQILLVSAALVVVSAGCGSAQAQGGKLATAGGATSTSAPGETAKADPVRFAQCMREAGIDMPDPSNDGGGGVIKIESAEPVQIGADGKPAGEDKFQGALEHCEQFMPVNPGGPGGMPEELKQQLLDMAKCMRTNGFPDFPDPDFSGGAILLDGPDSPVQDTEKFEAAMSACNKEAGLQGGSNG